MRIANFLTTAAMAAFLAGALPTSLALAHDHDRATESRNLATFSKIVLKGSADINIVAGQTQSVAVTTDSDYLSRVETEVKGDTLYISQEGSHWRNVDVTVEVKVETLNGVDVHGSGDMDITNLDSDNFEITIEGSGNINVSGKSASINVDIQGSGDVDLSGSCGSLSVVVDGSGDVGARSFKCESVDLTLDGSGDIDVYASNSLTVDMEGSGDVTIYGNPGRIKPKVQGSGSFEVFDGK